MKRDALQSLLAWKQKKDRKPLIIRGARQTGKTWLMKEFGRTCFKETVYINFESETRFKQLFEENYSVERIINTIQLHIGKTIDAGNTLLVFDEIQAVKGGLTSLKYFCEEAPQYAIVAAGSLLGISLHQDQSFPVGKVNFLDLHPLSFGEFLQACGKGGLRQTIEKREWETLAVFHDELLSYMRTYLYVGGMPEAVQKWIDSGDYAAVREVQSDILTSYQADFSKHAPHTQVPRINMVWNSLPAQLAKENKKFIYGVLREGARAKDFELAIMWLHDCGLVLKSHRVSAPRLPLNAYQDMQVFKLFMVDVGLLCAQSGIEARILLDGNRIFTEFKGALTEQFVMQELTCSSCDYIGYWTNERSTAEVDFVVQKEGVVIPIEVKAGENLRSRSFTLFCNTFEPERAYKVSALAHQAPASAIENIPLYGIATIGL